MKLLPKPAFFWRPLLGLWLPLALVTAAACMTSYSPPGPLGISRAIWGLFACAPLTSLLLALCWLIFDRRKTESQPED